MVTTESVMFEVGAIMLIAFIGAALASKAKQSVILGYILAGILIGPNIHLVLGGFSYDGVIQDTSFIEYLSYLGLILLMFFIGLEFSVSKLKRTRVPAALLAFINLGISMFSGVLLGAALGWPFIDTIFLAGIIAMSSTAITAKSVIELKRLQNPETEFLIGMAIAESFLSMVLLTIIGGLMIKGSSSSIDPMGLLIGIAAFYAFFVVLAIWVVPKTVSHLRKMKSDEMFVLFALGIVFLSAALAEVCGVPAIIGAFFIGMVFAETRVSERFEEKIVPFRDAFVAIFFVSFGMLIDPAMFSQVWWIVAIAVPIVILNDLVLTAIIAFFLGFSKKAATSMGSALCGRGAESVMYASVGSRSVGVTRGAELYPFAGAFCFIMSAITPLLMKKSDAIASMGSKLLPRSLKYSGAVISRTLGKMVIPQSLSLYRRTKRVSTVLIIFFIILMTSIVTQGVFHLIFFAAGIAVSVAAWRFLEAELKGIVHSISYENIGLEAKHHANAGRFVSLIVLVSLVSITTIAFLFTIYWWTVFFALIAYLCTMALLMRGYYYRSFGHLYAPNQDGARKGDFPATADFRRSSFKVPRRNKERWKWL
ncbi:MAG: cation:proton antiporter [Methanomassiliicoccales archaeon]|nr:cation:proton antiporter [Methanomassiliicoccales archaeon]